MRPRYRLLLWLLLILLLLLLLLLLYSKVEVGKGGACIERVEVSGGKIIEGLGSSRQS